MHILAWITIHVDRLTFLPYTPIASRIADRSIARREQQRDGRTRA